MRQRIKQTLSREKKDKFFLRCNINHKHLLHSDKSTLQSQSGDTIFFGAASQRDSKESLPATSSVRKRKGLFSSLTLLVLDEPVVTGLRRSFSVVTSEIPSEKVSFGLTNTYFCKSFSYSGTVPLVLASLALLFLVSCLINPISNGTNSVYATTTEDLGDGASISLSILNNGTEVADDGEVSTNVEVGQVSYIDNIVRVNTTRIGRYYVGVQAADGSSNELTNEDGVTIGVVGNNVSTDAFGDNTWGYVLTDNTTASSDTLSYSTLPVYSAANSPQYQSSDNPENGNHDLKLTFAAKIRADKPGGHYKTKAMVSVAAEAKELLKLPEYDESQLTTKFGDFTYMQDPGLAAYCQNSSTPDKTTGQLVDGRDGKIYWVTVLGTGAAKTCWMTQDLDLDINKVTFTTTNDGDNMYKGSDTTWTGNSVASKSSWTSNNNDIQWYERDTTHGTTHTSLGNLYSFEAATAGTGHNVTANNTPTTGSICPKGWKLPLSGNSANTVKGSFQSLQAVGMSSNTAAVGDPYYFQYGGYIGGSLNLVGTGGYYWSATSDNSRNAYDLYFHTNGNFYPAYSSARYVGVSVRCVVR